MSERVPVAIFCYNRRRHLEEMLRSYDACPGREETQPIIFCDGAKTPEAAAEVEAVQAFVRAWAEKSSAQVEISPVNRGLSASIQSGVSKILREYESVIVLEDDLVLGPSFLRFHLDGLRSFATAGNVYQISGYQWFDQRFFDRAFFAPLTTTWGWSTWRRAWQHFDANATGHERLRTEVGLRRRFDLEGRYPYADLLQGRLDGKNDSWGILWYWTVFIRQGLVLYPPWSTLSNAGFDGSGTHCADTGSVEQATISRARTIRMPASVAPSRLRYLWMKRALYRQSR